jgi:hypothetical protein
MIEGKYHQNILDYWSPVFSSNEKDLGNIISYNPIGFFSTTYSWETEFFEEECLSRFLMMESDLDSPLEYEVEQEIRLRELICGLIVTDQHSYNGKKNLRWDLLPCRISNGIMHSKISILCWSGLVRLIIGSANITEVGYCRNQEVFGVIDYKAGYDHDPEIIRTVLEYSKSLVEKFGHKIVNERFIKLASYIESMLNNWNNSVNRRKDAIRHLK